MRQTIRYGLIATLVLIPPAACLATGYRATPHPGNTTEITAMSDTPPPTSSELTAEELLQRVLELVRTSKSISDFTLDRLEKIMGVSVERGSDGYGHSARLTSQWLYDFSMRAVDTSTPEDGMRFAFGFDEIPDDPPPMTDICQLDFDHFTAELEAMGYTREPYYDSPPPADMGRPRLAHGRLIYESFSGPHLYIEVYPRGETSAKANHDCVKMLRIY